VASDIADGPATARVDGAPPEREVGRIVTLEVRQPLVPVQAQEAEFTELARPEHARTHRCAERNRCWWATFSTHPVSSMTVRRRSASSTAIARGFSTRTCLRAAKRWAAMSTWRWFGAVIHTASTAGESASSSGDANAWMCWYRSAPVRLTAEDASKDPPGGRFDGGDRDTTGMSAAAHDAQPERTIRRPGRLAAHRECQREIDMRHRASITRYGAVKRREEGGEKKEKHGMSLWLRVPSSLPRSHLGIGTTIGARGDNDAGPTGSRSTRAPGAGGGSGSAC
jgi:hypothetical protein